ncbi:MAG: prephenate dehydratase [Candidatus Omnitrophica bacterium]|nr:prephenate dehydratase [Candidatus Omnitrophota bacterium]MDD5610968.1 prephenate dehydratase [Candidatus Omnitrophota bacterium]
MNLKRLRKEIDRIDGSIVELLNQRAKFILKVGRIKNATGESIYSPARENEILKRLMKNSKGPLDKEALSAIYREIMSSALSLEKPIKIAYLGPIATFSHLAALKKFGSSVGYIPCDSISNVFLEVEKGTVDYGVVPVENSIEGAVTYTLDMLVDSDLKVCAQIILDISHNLLAKCPINKIKRLYSIPQVFGQCRMWLNENLPGVEQVEVSSTTRAAQIAAKEKGSACIASSFAAKVYGLKVLAADIEDSPYNITRFLVIGDTDVPVTGKDRTSILFSIKDRVGALHDMLLPFKKYKINMTKIESRPSKKKAWDYLFFVDFNGHYKNPNVKKALSDLEDKCKFLKILGSYPIGD